MTSNSIDETSDQGAPQHNRHFPRLCRSCGAPMSRQEDACWHCGAVWDDTVAPSVMTVAPPLEAMRPDTDRWANEGGSLPPDAPSQASVPAAAHG